MSKVLFLLAKAKEEMLSKQSACNLSDQAYGEIDDALIDMRDTIEEIIMGEG